MKIKGYLARRVSDSPQIVVTDRLAIVAIRMVNKKRGAKFKRNSIKLFFFWSVVTAQGPNPPRLEY